MTQNKRIDWILNCAVHDINFKCALKDLTESQIKFCLDHEKRKSAIDALKREARRKGIAIGALDRVSVTCPSCSWKGDQAKDWKAVVCPRCRKWIQLEAK